MDCNRGEEENDLGGPHSLEAGRETADSSPWERRYEKLWVEVEKREVKSNFRSVTSELKERFGELVESRSPAENVEEEQQAMAECISEEDEPSDEEGGDVMVRPMARTRTSVLLPIPEQAESGPEDSLTEPVDRMQVRERPARESSVCGEPDVEAFLKDDAEPAPGQKTHLELICEDTTTNLDIAVRNQVSLEEDLEKKPSSSSLSRRSEAVPGFSDEELEEDLERFKLEVGMLKVVFLDLEKEKAKLQTEVEDGRPRRFLHCLPLS